MHKSVSRSLSSRISSEFYEHLSIVEKCVGRCHKYVSILSDATTGKVIDWRVKENFRSIQFKQDRVPPFRCMNFDTRML